MWFGGVVGLARAWVGAIVSLRVSTITRHGTSDNSQHDDSSNMTTPKMLAGMTPNSHAVATFAFSPALLGQSPAAFLKNHRSPMPSGNFNSPGMFAALGVTGTPSMQQLPPDENKKRELAEILRVLGTRPGRISVAAVERLAKGMG